LSIEKCVVVATVKVSW